MIYGIYDMSGETFEYVMENYNVLVAFSEFTTSHNKKIEIIHYSRCIKLFFL